MKQMLRVGIGRTIINPELGVQLMGYPIESRPAKSIHDDLTATVLLLEQANDKAAIISLTISILDENEVNIIKEMVGNKVGIEPTNIIVSTIQTHSGPNTCAICGWSDKNEEYCADILRPSIVKAALQANENKKDAHLGIGTIHSNVGINRRQVLEDGSVSLGQNPWGPFDPTMTVLRFMVDKHPVANIIHYGAHPTSAGGTNEVTRDWPGVMIDKFEDVAGGTTLFLCGAVGDVGPRLSNGLTTGGNIKYVLEVGNRAGFDAVKAFNTIKEYRNLDLEILKDKIHLPFRPPIPLDIAKEKLKISECNKDKPGMPKAEYSFWKHLVGEYENNNIQTEMYFEQTIIRIGPVTFVPFPGEPFSDIVLRIREFSPYQHTLCLSTTNGNLGYFPTRDSLHRGGYEVEVAALKPHIFVENIDDILVQENLRLLRNMKTDPL